MKRVFFKLIEWIRCLFNSNPKSETILNEDLQKKESENIVSENPYVSKDYSKLTEEPTIDENLLELQNEKSVHKLYSRKDRALTLHSGEIFLLTEKQAIFYKIIKELQQVGEASSRNILWRYLNQKHRNISDGELETLAKTQKLSAHNKTLKGMFKSGLLIRISKNEYRVKI